MNFDQTGIFLHSDSRRVRKGKKKNFLHRTLCISMFWLKVFSLVLSMQRLYLVSVNLWIYIFFFSGCLQQRRFGCKWTGSFFKVSADYQPRAGMEKKTKNLRGTSPSCTHPLWPLGDQSHNDKQGLYHRAPSRQGRADGPQVQRGAERRRRRRRRR